MSEELQKKMQLLMYCLTKDAARYSYKNFLEMLDIGEDDYKLIKAEWKEKLGVTPYV